MLHVVVVGAGPAGLVAAATLAQGGLKVTLVERHFGRARPCAQWVTSTLLAEFGLPSAGLSQRLSEMAVFSPTSRVAFLPLASVERHAGILPRETLKTELHRRAEAAGVQSLPGRFTRFLHGEGDYPLLEVRSSDGTRHELAADVVIAADGASSRVARALRLAPLPLSVAYQERFSLSGASAGGSGNTLNESMQLYFGRRLSLDAYGYLVPQGDTLVLGASTPTANGKRVWDMLAEIKRRVGSHLDGARPVGRESYCFPRAQRARLAHERVLFVGDAAGLVPVVSHDGLYFAMASGRMAAETILRHQNLPLPEHLAEFERDWTARYGALFAQEAKLSQLFFSQDRRREALIDLSWDRALAKLAMDTLLSKQTAVLPLKLTWRVKAKAYSQLIKYAVVTPKRPERGPALARRSLPSVAAEPLNYLDLALKTPTGQLGLPRQLPLAPSPEAATTEEFAADALEAALNAPPPEVAHAPWQQALESSFTEAGAAAPPPFEDASTDPAPRPSETP